MQKSQPSLLKTYFRMNPSILYSILFFLSDCPCLIQSLTPIPQYMKWRVFSNRNHNIAHSKNSLINPLRPIVTPILMSKIEIFTRINSSTDKSLLSVLMARPQNSRLSYARGVIYCLCKICWIRYILRQIPTIDAGKRFPLNRKETEMRYHYIFSFWIPKEQYQECVLVIEWVSFDWNGFGSCIARSIWRGNLRNCGLPHEPMLLTRGNRQVTNEAVQYEVCRFLL